jgi:hypothetical protein
MSDHEPGEYAKDGRRKQADTRADAVALVFEGYSRVEDEPTQVDLPDEDEPDEDEDAVNGVGTLGTGEVSQDKTPSAPTPTTVFGSISTP